MSGNCAPCTKYLVQQVHCIACQSCYNVCRIKNKAMTKASKKYFTFLASFCLQNRHPSDDARKPVFQIYGIGGQTYDNKRFIKGITGNCNRAGTGTKVQGTPWIVEMSNSTGALWKHLSNLHQAGRRRYV